MSCIRPWTCSAPTARRPSRSAAQVRAPPATATKERAPPATATKERAPPATATKERAPPATATKERASPATATKERAPPATATKDRAPPATATKERAPPATATKERARPATATKERAPPATATKERAPPATATKERAPPATATQERAPATAEERAIHTADVAGGGGGRHVVDCRDAGRRGRQSWAAGARKRGEAWGGRPECGGASGQQKPSNDPHTNHPSNQHNPRCARYWAPRTRKRHQQEHRPQWPTERSDPTQHAKGRAGDCPGPRKGATTGRNVTQGGGGGLDPPQDKDLPCPLCA